MTGYRNIFKALQHGEVPFLERNGTLGDIADSKNAQKIQLRDSSGRAILCRYYKSEHPKRLVVAVHDCKSSFDRDFQSIFPFLNKDCDIFSFDLLSHGCSDGHIISFGTEDRHTCLLVCKYACEYLASDLPVYLFGMGTGGTAVLMASGYSLPQNVRGIIAEAAAPDAYSYVCHNIKKHSGEHFYKLTARGLDRLYMKHYGISMFDYSCEEALKSNNLPVLMFHSEYDEESPLAFANEIYGKCRSEKQLEILKNSSHLFLSEESCKCREQKLCEFFKKHDEDPFIIKTTLHYPEKTMFEMIEQSAKRLPDDIAYSFKGKRTSYKKMLCRIEDTAKGFAAGGIKAGDIVTICMPNTPQAVDCFYALNRISAVASLIHPLSAVNEIVYYLKLSESKMILTLDMFYEKVAEAVKLSGMDVKILVARIGSELPVHLKGLYLAAKGREFLSFPDSRGGELWDDFILKGKDFPLPRVKYKKDSAAVVLYSGGTTGEPKGIMLSDMNFNALAMQARIAMECEFSRGLKNLSAMPMFHGFGLGIGIHTVLCHNACCVLMPQVNTKEYASEMLREKPDFIAGVPTIFKMLIGCKRFKSRDLSFLKGMFVGGDSMPVELKNDVDGFLSEHSADLQVREGYGLTECVTASCLTPKRAHRKGSVGLPFPDMSYKIVEPDTENELEAGREGEIVINGPTVMLGYLNNEEETKNTLKKHSDGKIWLHTGDMGYIDSDGYVYFTQRIKRLIISAGYNVYPSQIEKAVELHPAVDYCCVVGVPDEYKMEHIKAYVVLKDSKNESDEMKKDIISHLRRHIAAYEMPREIEFRKELPKTLVGKVAYRML